jgi:hypothetical protein
MEKFGDTRFGFSNIFSVMLILLLVVMLVGIIAALAFGTLPSLGTSGFVVPRVDSVTVQGQEVLRIQHKGGDTFQLNGSSSPFFPVISFTVETQTGREKARVDHSIQKYTFSSGDVLWIYRTGSGYVVTDAVTKVNTPVLFADGTCYLLFTDETRHIVIMRSGPY